MLDLSHRAVATQNIMRYFDYSHLPAKLQDVSRPCCNLAEYMVNFMEDSAELTVGLRKLLEAKDCFVRALLQ